MNWMKKFSLSEIEDALLLRKTLLQDVYPIRESAGKSYDAAVESD